MKESSIDDAMALAEMRESDMRIRRCCRYKAS